MKFLIKTAEFQFSREKLFLTNSAKIQTTLEVQTLMNVLRYSVAQNYEKSFLLSVGNDFNFTDCRQQIFSPFRAFE